MNSRPKRYKNPCPVVIGRWVLDLRYLAAPTASGKDLVAWEHDANFFFLQLDLLMSLPLIKM